MKMTGTETDREKVPLMKDLHEIGLKHRVQFVVVAIPMLADDPEGIRPLLIDHKDDTTIKEVHDRFVGAGVFLLKCAGAAEELMAEQAEEKTK